MVDVEQSRLGSALTLGDVQVDLRLECRGTEHREQILRALSDLPVRVLDHG